MRRERSDNRWPAGSTRSGFSLLELMIVMGILGILLALAVPSYLNHASNQRARTAAQVLAADLSAARQEAVQRRATVTVTFGAADGSCQRDGGPASYAVAQASSVLKRTCFPRDVVWGSLSRARLTFQSTGAAPAGMSLRVRSARTAATYTVLVAAETGVITHDAR